MKRLSLSLIVTLIVGIGTSGSVLAATEYQASSSTSNSSQLIAKATNTIGGQFVAVEHPTQGQVQIIEEDGAKYLEFDQNFQSDRGPDLKVILHQANAVELKVKEGEYQSLGALQSFNGTQRYLIPEDVDLTQYQSVAIWCEEFNATFGYAPLTQ